MTFIPNITHVSTTHSHVSRGIQIHISPRHWMKKSDFYTTWTPCKTLYFVLNTEISWHNLRSFVHEFDNISAASIADEICAQLTWSNRIVSHDQHVRES